MERDRVFRHIGLAVMAIFLFTSLAAALEAYALPNPPVETGEFILINKATNKLYFYRDGELVKEYPVTTDRSPELTPEGNYTILTKGVNTPGANSPNPRPGNSWLGLSAGGARHKYGIHGANEPSYIGAHASGGCIRMHNEDVEELFELVPTGTPVQIRRGNDPLQSVLLNLRLRSQK
jgi:lipoprotein-anchoring transpeptidase ErfK/SrfK